MKCFSRRLLNAVALLSLLLCLAAATAWVRSRGHYETWEIERRRTPPRGQPAYLSFSVTSSDGQLDIGRMDFPSGLGGWSYDSQLDSGRGSSWNGWVPISTTEPAAVPPDGIHFSHGYLPLHRDDLLPAPTPTFRNDWHGIDPLAVFLFGRHLLFPHWFAVLVTAALPLTVFVASRVRRRRRAIITRRGLCPACGYDLRASLERCPECGRVKEVAPPST